MKMTQQQISPSKEPPAAAFIHGDAAQAGVLHVLGEVDLSNAQEFEAALTALTNGSAPVVADLTACTYMDSSGLRVLATVHKAIEDRLRVVIPQSGSVARIFEITGLADQFKACETVDAALRKRE